MASSIHDRSETSDPVEQEIAFWRGFILWWETKEGKPATPRMREALAHAVAKYSAVHDKPVEGGRTATRPNYRVH